MTGHNPLSPRRGAALGLALMALCLLPTAASASGHSGETADTIATVLAWFIVCVMPIAGVIVFWKVHILPEHIAEKRHHPQKDAIQVLCLLSLVFGGLLWPIAWLWAYVRPVSNYAVYGTEKHEDYFHEMGEKFHAGELSADDVEELREELDAIASKSRLPRKLKTLRRELDAAPREAGTAALSGGGAA